MRIKELQTLLDGQPSVSGNTFIVGGWYVISCLLTLLFFVLGVGLLLESAFHFRIFLDWVSAKLRISLNEEQRWQIATTLGLISLVLAVVFAGVIFLCKMILNRNHFIIRMEDWIYGNLPEVRRTVRSRQAKK
jgi:uncharacterized membrane protein YciS (DUF1049 family)